MDSKLHEVLLKLTKPMNSKDSSEYIKKKHPEQNNNTVMGEDYLDSVAIEYLKEKQQKS